MLQCTIKSVYFRITEISSTEEDAQGDRVTIYGIGVTPLINKLIDIIVDEHKVAVKLLPYVDDFWTTGELKTLELNEIGPKFGDYPEPTKFQLVVKPHTIKYVEEFFFGAKIKVASVDEKYLRGTIRISYFENIYFKENLNQWISELELLSKITTLEPKAAYCAFAVGLKHQIKLFQNIKTNSSFQHLLMGFSLTVYLEDCYTSSKCGGMRLVIFSKIVNMEYTNSKKANSIVNKTSDRTITYLQCQWWWYQKK